MSTTAAPSVLTDARTLVGRHLDDTAADLHRRLGDVVGVAVTTTAADGTPTTVGASTDLAARVDRTQFEVGDGPCLQALRTGEGLHVVDLAADPRWGAYGARAAALGVASCVSVPVGADAGSGRPLAVFKVYAGEVDGLDADQLATASTVAREIAGGFALAGHLVRLAGEVDDLTAVLTHRRAIDLAVGISMERAQVDAATAFGLLRARSQQANTKLHEVAAAVVASVAGSTDADLVAPYDPHG